MGCDVLIEEGFGREPMIAEEKPASLSLGFVQGSQGSWLAIDVAQVTEARELTGRCAVFGLSIFGTGVGCISGRGGLRSRFPDGRFLPGDIEKVLTPAHTPLL